MQSSTFLTEKVTFGRGKKKPGRKAPAVSLDYPGSSSRASVGFWGSGGGGASPPWLPPLPFLAHTTHPLKNDHPWSLHRSQFPGYITPPNGTFPGGLSRSSSDRLFRNTLRKLSELNDLPWSPPAYPLHYETGFLS
jgi:hypothetical protein